MQPNYWKFGVILLLVFLLCGVLFFFINNDSSEKVTLPDKSKSVQTQPLVSNTELNGEIFVVTQGSGNVKIGLAEVVIENQQTKQSFKTTTNADGKFSVIVPSGSYLLSASSTRIYQVKLSEDANKEMLAKSLMDKSLSEKYRLYDIAILKKHLAKIEEFSKDGIPSNEVLARNFVQISEYCNWKFPINLNQSNQSLQLSNNNLTNFGLKE